MSLTLRKTHSPCTLPALDRALPLEIVTATFALG